MEGEITKENRGVDNTGENKAGKEQRYKEWQGM